MENEKTTGIDLQTFEEGLRLPGDVLRRSAPASSPTLSIIPHLGARIEGKGNEDRPSVPDKVLFGLSFEQLTAFMQSLGQPAYRARQLAQALYRDRNSDLASIATFPQELRSRIEQDGWVVGRPEIAHIAQSTDGTERYLVKLSDGKTVETVWMPDGDGGESGDGTAAGEENEGVPASGRRRATICVSSQVGCAVNCQFCLTAKLGLERNLTVGEIVGQVAAVLARHGADPRKERVNLVFMGMGEPLLNYDNFINAVRLLVQELKFAESRMTVSTSGIIPGMERLAGEPIRPKLAISINAPNNEIRSQVMPLTKKWPLEAVLEAASKLPLRTREKLTFEYVLLGGVTDLPKHAGELARLVKQSGLPVKINLIAWNPGPEIAYSSPDPAAVSRFQELLISKGIPAFIRRPRGRDIYAACGQLKRTTS